MYNDISKAYPDQNGKQKAIGEWRCAHTVQKCSHPLKLDIILSGKPQTLEILSRFNVLDQSGNMK